MRVLPSFVERCKALIAEQSISSTRPDLDQSNAGVIAKLHDWFTALGFVCEIMPVMPGKLNLIARLGVGSNGLILAGHTDTVPCDESLWKSNPFDCHEAQDRLYGLGIIDMKGFFSFIIEALGQFDLGQIKRPLTIIATCDEESSMSGAHKLAQLGQRLGGQTIIGEPTGGRVIRAHKGVLMDRLTLTGQSGHSSDPSLGRSALDAMGDCLNALKALRSQWRIDYNHDAFKIPYPTLNLGCIHGGDNPNRICGQCVLDYDVRTVPGMDPEEIRASVRSAIEPICRAHEVKFEIKALIDALPSFEESGQCDLVNRLEELTGAKSNSVAFGTEAPHFKKISDEVVIFGAGSIDVAHQPNEYLDLCDVKPMVETLSKIIYRSCFQEF